MLAQLVAFDAVSARGIRYFREHRAMSCRPAIILAALVALGISSSPAKADEISFVGDLWPPFNGVSGSNSEGYLLDIAREIFEPQGHHVSYVVLPWARAVREVRAGTYNALLGPFISEAPGLIFPEEEVGYTRLSFFTRADSKWRFTGPESLKNIRMGIIQGYGYRPWLQEYRQRHSENFIVMSGEDAVLRNLQLLIRGRIDAIPTNEYSFRYRAKQAGVLDQIRFAGYDTLGKGQKLYIAFAPNRRGSADYAKLLSTGIRDLRRTGRLAKILKRYEIKDWKR